MKTKVAERLLCERQRRKAGNTLLSFCVAARGEIVINIRFRGRHPRVRSVRLTLLLSY